MIQCLKQKNKTGRGFTLVEMMVAIAVFSMVMSVAMSALLNVIDANLKAQAIKTAINNVNFALESISKDMRVGTGYSCLDDNGNETDCDLTNGNEGVQYISSQGQEVSYIFVAGDDDLKGSIKKKIATADFQDITSQEVDIKKMKFYVIGTEDVTKQPRVVITISGEAGSKEKIKTTFDLQTSVSQRTRDINN